MKLFDNFDRYLGATVALVPGYYRMSTWNLVLGYPLPGILESSDKCAHQVSDLPPRLLALVPPT